MQLERYECSISSSMLEYDFWSEGPKGKIRKKVSYCFRNMEGVTYLNLGFGDWDEVNHVIDCETVSNNKDSNKVLATVAATVLTVTDHFPDMMIFAMGSTPARTRLYQMGIRSHWGEIDGYLHIYGFRNGQWEPFCTCVNYEGFLATRKK